MKNIIVEGPDGSGKSTLIAHLVSALGLSVHDRAVTSKDGPIMPLAKWVDEDLMEDWNEPCLYDRYPTISEPIYGRWVRQEIQTPFDSDMYLSRINEILYRTAVVVWCLPDLETVRVNVEGNADDQMPGVTANIARVHQSYMTAYFRWRGAKRRYDYRHDDRDKLTAQLKRMIEECPIY